ncbi:UNVERIFIED_CONTAM: phosphoglycolate phosphatase/pyrophosphatase PpaX [Acetivibrio alkalicellulosi]
MKLNTIIFDLDGTLADTVPLTIFSIKEVVRELAGKEMSDEDVIREFGPVDTKIVENLVDEKIKDKAVNLYIKIFSENFDKYVQPIKGITELFDVLMKNRIRIGLFTGRGLKVSNIILEKLKIKNYFDAFLTGDDTKKPKPDPEGIHMVLNRLDSKPYESAYVGDFDVDIMASKAAGVMSILALWASNASTKLLELNPDKSFKTPYEFIDWIEKGAI